MNIEIVTENGRKIAHISGSEKIITDAASALDLTMSVMYSAETNRLCIAKEAVCDDFFILSTGIAGEILQKFINYHVTMAIYGDFSHYTSKPLKDFIYESNQGRHFFFVETKEEAIRRLSEIK